MLNGGRLSKPIGTEMKMIRIVLVIALICLQYKLWFGEAGLLQLRRLTQKSIALEQENKLLQERNRGIESDIVGLKSSGQALEEQARSQLGMVKDGESYYQFVE